MPAYVHVDPDLTAMTVKIYNSLREYWLIAGSGPSKFEVAKSCLCSSVSVYKAEKILRAKGYIVSPKHEIRSMKPTDLDRVLSATEPDPWDTLDLDRPIYWRAGPEKGTNK